jgi:hypothetical protein
MDSTVGVTQTGLMADGLHINPFGWSEKKTSYFENQQMTAKCWAIMSELKVSLDFCLVDGTHTTLNFCRKPDLVAACVFPIRGISCSF